MASLLLTQMTFALSLVVFVRVFTYRRNGARYRLGMSAVAVLVMIATGRLMIETLLGGLVVPAECWPLVLLLAVFAVSMMRTGGNVAGLLRPEPEPWSGDERRRVQS